MGRLVQRRTTFTRKRLRRRRWPKQPRRLRAKRANLSLPLLLPRPLLPRPLLRRRPRRRTKQRLTRRRRWQHRKIRRKPRPRKIWPRWLPKQALPKPSEKQPRQHQKRSKRTPRLLLLKLKVPRRRLTKQLRRQMPLQANLSLCPKRGLHQRQPQRQQRKRKRRRRSPRQRRHKRRVHRTCSTVQ